MKQLTEHTRHEALDTAQSTLIIRQRAVDMKH